MKALKNLFFSTTLMVMTAMLLSVSQVHAVSYNTLEVTGGYNLSDSNGDGFAETLQLTPFLSFSTGASGFQLIGSAAFSTLTLDPNSVVTQGPSTVINFNPDFYAAGFSVTDSAGQVIFTADLSVDHLTVDAHTGVINEKLHGNLDNITAGAGHVPGQDAAVDEIIASLGGALVFTFQNAGLSTLSGAILGNTPLGGVNGSFSASAVSTPEPSTLALLGIGLFGLGILGRKKIKEK